MLVLVDVSNKFISVCAHAHHVVIFYMLCLVMEFRQWCRFGIFLLH